MHHQSPDQTLGQRLQARGDVDPVAVDIAFVNNDIAEIHANTKLNFVMLQGRPDRGRAIRRWIAAAHWTASTTLANSTSAPSPMSLTIRPWNSSIAGSTNSRRQAFSRGSVPTSSSPMRRL
jgi:hypothetical protein